MKFQALARHPPKLPLRLGKLPVVLMVFAWIACLSATQCPNSPPGAGVRWTNYPKLSESPTVYRWLVVECRFADVPDVPAGLDLDIRQFLGLPGAGYGNMADYIHDVSYNNAVFATEFVDWVRAPFKLTDLKDPRTPVAVPRRAERVRECLEAIPENQSRDLSGYYGVIAVGNAAPADASACYAGQQEMTVKGNTYRLACVWLDVQSMGTNFAAHEIGHGFGLEDSFDNSQDNCGGSPGRYCDPWDIMSGSRAFRFPDRNWLIAGRNTEAGPGMSAPDLLQLDWIPSANQQTFDLEGDEQTFTLSALSHPRIGTPLVVLLNVGASPFSELYTIEYRQGDGWDLGFVRSSSSPMGVRLQGGTVLVHQFRSRLPIATLIENTDRGARQPGSTLIVNSALGPIYHIAVKRIDTATATATVSIGFGRG